jgi:acetyl-CoA carboxylase biotin carboxylase subunit
VRLDDGVYPGWTVPTDYDPLLGKVIVWAENRAEAIARMRRALDEYYISGIKTNVAFFKRLLAEPEFVRGEVHTRWLDELLQRAPAPRGSATAETAARAEDAALVAAALWHGSKNGAARPTATDGPGESRWKNEGRAALLDRAPQRRS